MEAEKGQSKNILQIWKNIQNSYLWENGFLKGCQIEKTIWFVALPIIYQIS